jgi:hypothetical protein
MSDQNHGELEHSVADIETMTLEDKKSPVAASLPLKTTPLFKSEKFRQLLRENLTNEMFSAIQNIMFSSSQILKCHLFVFMILANGLASFTGIQLVLGYLNYGVITTTRTLFETPSPFPKVTLCSPNLFTTRAGLDFVLNELDFNESNLEHMDLNERQMLNWKMKNLAVEKFEEMNETQKRSLTHDLDQVLLSCFFNSQPCSSRDFQWGFSNVFGNCFSFSAGFNASNHKVDLKHSYSSGYGQGLRFDLYVNSHEQLTSFNSITGGTGAIIHLSNT